MMNNSVLFTVTVVAVFLAYLALRNFIAKTIQSNEKRKQNDNSKKIIMVTNIVSAAMMFGLIVFLWNGLVQRWQDGNQNYFNLILLIVLTLACVIKFWNNFKNNKV